HTGWQTRVPGRGRGFLRVKRESPDNRSSYRPGFRLCRGPWRGPLFVPGFLVLKAPPPDARVPQGNNPVIAKRTQAIRLNVNQVRPCPVPSGSTPTLPADYPAPALADPTRLPGLPPATEGQPPPLTGGRRPDGGPGFVPSPLP